MTSRLKLVITQSKWLNFEIQIRNSNIRSITWRIWKIKIYFPTIKMSICKLGIGKFKLSGQTTKWKLSSAWRHQCSHCPGKQDLWFITRLDSPGPNIMGKWHPNVRGWYECRINCVILVQVSKLYLCQLQSHIAPEKQTTNLPIIVLF